MMIRNNDASRFGGARDNDADGLDLGANIVQDELSELDRLKKEKLKTIYEIERYKKLITYAIVISLLSFLLAVTMVVWRFTMDEPSFEELRRKVIGTPDEAPRLVIYNFILYLES
jgi:hypothetical protein